MFSIFGVVCLGNPVERLSRKVHSTCVFRRLKALPVVLFAVFLIADGAGKEASAQTPATTTTTLSVTLSGGGVTTISAGSVVTLTASVTGGSGTLTRGQVNFCDASAKVCADIHLLGMAQLTSAGTATLKFRPAIGSHSYKAVFLGTTSYAGSSSTAASLMVTGTVGPFSTSTSISKAGSWSNYSLTETVTEIGGTASPTGTASFLDTSNGNSVLATAQLGVGVPGLAMVAQPAIASTSSAGATATGDFNGDGIPDVAVFNGNTIAVYFGKGDGTFVSGPLTSAGGVAGISLVVADFNGDDVQDLAAVYVNSFGSYNFVIFIGKGDGSFTAAPSPTTGINPYGIAVGDFNGDGIADLAVTQVNVNSITILLGNGDGTFTTSSVSMTEAYSPNSIVAGDFNGDGKQDLAVVSSGVAILPGNGDGTFGAISNINTGQSSISLVVGDFNADGKLDVFAASDQATMGAVLLGNGDGTFSVTPTGTSGSTNGAVSVMAGDFNGDGIADVATVLADSTQLALFLGKGDGTFTEIEVNAPSSSIRSYFAAADLNGDGLTDFVDSITSTTAVQGLLMEPTQTAAATATAISPGGAGQHSVDASYSGDSNYTTSVSGTTMIWGQPPTTTTVLAMTAGGSPVTTVNTGTAVTLTATVMAGANPLTTGQVSFCDATASECTDIHLIGTAALTANGTAGFKFVPGPGQHSYKAVLQENSGGVTSSSGAVTLTVSPLPSVVYPTTTSIAQTGSVGNYTLTAVVAEIGGAASITGNVSFLDTSYSNSVLATAPLSSSPGLTWNLSSSLPYTNGSALVAAGDFNGDGIIDVAGINTNAKAINILLGKGDGTFTAAAGITSSAYMTGIVTGDFNGDGKLDIAVSSVNATYGQPGFMQIFLGNGDGTFNAVSSTQTIANSAAVFAAADFNGDGKLDLIVNENNNVSILLGNGDGTFTQGPAPGVVANSYSPLIAVADLNGDGVPDLVVGYNNLSFQVYLGNGDSTFRQAGQTLSLAGTAGAVAAVVGDFNGDGIPDLGVIGGYFGIATVFLGKGDGTFTQAAASPNVSSIYAPAMAAADLNHDGKLDLVITNGNSSSGNAQNPDLTVLLGNGDGTFTNTFVDTQLSPTNQVVTADVNGDGTPDLVVGTSTGVSVLKTLPTQTATATATSVSPSGPAPHLVAANYPGDSNYSSSTSGTTSLNVQAAAPAFTPSSGAYTSIPSISIADATPGATIYYSATGTAVVGISPTYNGPIPIYSSGTVTIQAYATATGYQQSATTTATYTITLFPAPAPVFSVAGGYYPGTQTVTISDAQPGVSIFYTTNGQQPTQYSILYTGPITVSSSETLTAVAVGGGFSASPLMTAQYFIGSSSSSFIYTIAGNDSLGYAGDGGPATMASLNVPNFAAVDSSGNIYIADTGNNVVRKVAAGTGIISTLVGTGISGYSGDNGPASAAQLLSPTALALDASGNLYITDNGNHVVRKVTASSGIITTYAGNASATALGDNGPATSAQLSDPEGLALDSAGNLYIGTLTRVRKVTASTGIITTAAGNGSPGDSGDKGLATNASIFAPFAIAIDSAGNLYIGDSQENVVRKVTASTGVITTVAGVTYSLPLMRFSGDGGPATSAHLYVPSGVAVDNAGNLFIADSDNDAIREVSASTGIITTIAGVPPSCVSLSGDGGPAGNAGLCLPQSLVLDGAGNMYIAVPSQNRIRKVTVSAPTPATATAPPVFSVPAGTYVSPQTVTITDATPGAEIYITLNGVTPTPAQLAGYYAPINVSGSATIEAVAVAPGYLPSSVVTGAYTITTPPTALISTVAGTGVSGSAGSGGVATNQELTNPYGVATDSNGNQYFADYYNAVVWKISLGTSAISVAAGTLGVPGAVTGGIAATSATLNGPTHVALDGAANLYIADSTNGVVRKVSALRGIITTYAGGAAPTNATGDGGPATSAYIPSPQGLAFDSSGNLYIADQTHNTIRKVTAAGVVTTFAGTSGTAGAGFAGDGGLATAALLSGPYDLTLDSQGNLYIADAGGGRVRMVAANTGIITTVAGNGDRGGSGDGNMATAAEIYARGLAIDVAGNLYIANWPNTIRRVPAGGGVITTIAGNGYTGISGDGGSASVAELSSPIGLTFDSVGSLYIADSANYRIRKIVFPGPAATPAFSLVAGTYRSIQTVTITDGTPGATIYYTTDGSAPTTGSTAYTGPITLSSTETLQAIAVASGFTQSPVVSANYIINLLTPVITWATPAAITYGTALSSAQLNATSSLPGTFTYIPSPGAILGAGSQTLSVAFTPTDTSDDRSTTSTVALVVNKAQLNISASNATRVFGAANPTFVGAITGAVSGDTFTESFSTLATLSSPVGSYMIVPAVSGSNSADYTITPTNGALTISQVGTSTALVLSNQNLTLTATVTSITSGTPTGTVGFYEGQTSVGTGTLNNGVATYTTASFPSGDVSVSAQYSGDTNFTQSSTSPILFAAVSPVSSSLTVSSGSSISDVLNIAVPAGYSGTIQFTCSGLPQGATCSFQPSSVTFNGSSNTANTTLTIQTTAHASVVPQSSPFTNSSRPASAAILGIPGLLALASVGRRRKFNVRLLTVLLLLCGLSMALTSCSGGSSAGGSSTGGSSSGTPAGASTVQVIATGPGGLIQTTSLALTVQ